jgi:uncharacterized protein (DUF2336 family)
MTPQQRAKAAQRVLVVAANTEVQERGLLKHARLARSISAALRARGADELTARLGAEVGMLAFRIALERWMESDDDEPFARHAAAALSELQTRAAELDSRSRLSAECSDAAVDLDHLAGDIARRGTGQEEHDIRHVLGTAQPAQG